MVVTFLHGFGQTGASWEEVTELLPRRWTCLVPDLEQTTMEACRAQLEDLWQTERVHLVGYSMGGRLALHVAARDPGRLLSLVTISAHAGLPSDQRERRRREDERLACLIEEQGSRAFADHFQGLALFSGEAKRGAEFVERRRQQRLAQDPARLAAVLRGMGAGAMEPVWDDLPRFSSPALFVAGEQDPVYAAHAQRLAASVSRGRAVVLPGRGHGVHLEDPGAFKDLLIDHLDHLSAR